MEKNRLSAGNHRSGFERDGVLDASSGEGSGHLSVVADDEL
jgi:hypothetical protein